MEILVLVYDLCWDSLLYNEFFVFSQLRGALFFLLGAVALLLFDHDDRLHHISDHECILSSNCTEQQGVSQWEWEWL